MFCAGMRTRRWRWSWQNATIVIKVAGPRNGQCKRLMEVAGPRNGQPKRSGENLVAKEDDMNQQNMADNKWRNGLLKTIPSIRGVRSAASAVLMVAALMVALNATAKAQCGDSLSAMASSAASVRSQPQISQSSQRHAFSEGKSLAAEPATASDNAVNPSIVG